MYNRRLKSNLEKVWHFDMSFEPFQLWDQQFFVVAKIQEKNYCNTNKRANKRHCDMQLNPMSDMNGCQV